MKKIDDGWIQKSNHLQQELVYSEEDVCNKTASETEAQLVLQKKLLLDVQTFFQPAYKHRHINSKPLQRNNRYIVDFTIFIL